MVICNTFSIDFEISRKFSILFHRLLEKSKDQDTSNKNPSAETTKSVAVGTDIALGHELTSSQVNIKLLIKATHI